MKTKSIIAAALILASLGIATGADAQAWGPPPPPPPYGFAPPPPPPPGPPPLPGPHVVGRWHWGQPGYQFYRPHCWTEYRDNGWTMVKVCQ